MLYRWEPRVFHAWILLYLCMILKSVFTVAVMCALCCSAFAVVPPWEVDELTGKDAPSFSLADVMGKQVSLKSLGGRVIVLNFWATWCAPCKVEMPSLNELHRRYRDKGLVVVAIAVDDSWEPVRKFLDTVPLDFPVLLDSGAVVSRDYKVYAFPTTFIIDNKGVVREHFVGEEDWLSEETVRRIERYVEK